MSPTIIHGKIGEWKNSLCMSRLASYSTKIWILTNTFGVSAHHINKYSLKI
jgi:hypothetical protein